MTPLLALAALSLFGYHLTFDAEMSQPADMSQFINSFANGDTRLYQNHEQENYVPYNPANTAVPYSFSNGALVINATPVPANGMPYTSGMLETAGIFSQSTGYFEMRAAMPSAQGFWPAFWMLPDGGYYPEIDTLEQPNNSGTLTQYWTHINSPTDGSGGFTDVGTDVFSGYHSYGFLWTPNAIQFVFDGNLVGYPHTTPPSMAGLAMYMIANLAVGDQYSWPGAPSAGAASSLSIDHIRVFSNDPTVPGVAQAPISAPDGAATLPVLAPPLPPVPKPIGTGLNTLVVQLAEDSYQGVDAQFTISIDGRLRGGVQTASANHLMGQTQAFAVRGDYGRARHTVSVNFLNDASGNDGDRNLYVLGATIDGVTVHDAVLNLYGSGAQSFNFCGNAVAPVSIGTGPDSLVLDISEDVHIGNAKYTISVDGVQQGGTQITSAWHGYGQTQAVSVNGSFGPASHTVTLNFLNGAVAGAASNGINLYVDGVSYDGVALPGATTSFTNRGGATLQTKLQQPDTVSLNLAEDAWNGNAQADISIDGQDMGTTSITAAKGATPQTLTYSGNFGGPDVAHSIVVNYLNDAYALRGQDRNLYVQGITVDGTPINGTRALMVGGPVSFAYVAPTVAPGSAWTPVPPK